MLGFISAIVKFVFFLSVLLGVIGAVLRIFFVDTAVIGHNGMAPTIIAGDEIAFWKGASVDLGDVTICAHPTESGRMVIGRIIGKPGFTIDTNHDQLQINGDKPKVELQGTHNFFDTVLQESEEMSYGIEKLHGEEHAIYEHKGTKFFLQPVSVTQGLFLLSDNRTYGGEDSRYFGEVDPSTCLGKVFLRLEPAKDSPDFLEHNWFDAIH